MKLWREDLLLHRIMSVHRRVEVTEVCILHIIWQTPPTGGAERGIEIEDAIPWWQRLSFQRCNTVMGVGDSRGTGMKSLDLQSLSETWKMNYEAISILVLYSKWIQTGKEQNGVEMIQNYIPNSKYLPSLNFGKPKRTLHTWYIYIPFPDREEGKILTDTYFSPGYKRILCKLCAVWLNLNDEIPTLTGFLT